MFFFNRGRGSVGVAGGWSGGLVRQAKKNLRNLTTKAGHRAGWF